MMRRAFGILLLLPALLAGMPSSAWAEVKAGDDGGIFSRPGNYGITCWQNGVKILDKGNLTSLKENPVTGQQPIQFVTRGKDRLPFQIFNLGETFCIVQGEP